MLFCSSLAAGLFSSVHHYVVVIVRVGYYSILFHGDDDVKRLYVIELCVVCVFLLSHTRVKVAAPRVALHWGSTPFTS